MCARRSQRNSNKKGKRIKKKKGCCKRCRRRMCQWLKKRIKRCIKKKVGTIFEPRFSGYQFPGMSFSNIKNKFKRVNKLSHLELKRLKFMSTESTETLFRQHLSEANIALKDIDLVEGLESADLKEKYSIKGSKANILDDMIDDYKKGNLSLSWLRDKSALKPTKLNKRKINKMLRDYTKQIRTKEKDEEQRAGPSRRLSRIASESKEKNKNKVKPSNKAKRKSSKSLKDRTNNSTLEDNLSKKVWRLMSSQVFSTVRNNDSDDKTKSDDTATKKFKTRGVGKNKIWESLQHLETAQMRSSGTNPSKHDYASKKSNKSKSSLKMKVRRKLWNLSKKTLKENEHWKSLMAENNINVDRVNIDKVDLSLIDVDGLGIENKFLKKTVTWLLN